MQKKFMRVVSGMRPTGGLHLGHYHGVLKNWLKLQNEYESLFFAADWHALTTHYTNTTELKHHTLDMVIDWLAVGIDPEKSTIFVQSRIQEHAELHTLLSMITPLGWLERVPTYKEQQEKLQNKDLSTYGFLGYPLLQSADILAYRAGMVPVGEDQAAHVELTRELARRFNFLYGRGPDLAQKAEAAAKKTGKKNYKIYQKLKIEFQQQGKHTALQDVEAFLQQQRNLTAADKELLQSYLAGRGKTILPVPQALLSKTAKMPGTDGQKMSKSYNNTISLREKPKELENKIRTMPTDPARVKRTDPGDPKKCPVWEYHMIYSDSAAKNAINTGCKSASIGCIDCKKHIIDAMTAELEPIQNKIQKYLKNPAIAEDIIQEGCKKASIQAKHTMVEVREAMGLGVKY